MNNAGQSIEELAGRIYNPKTREYFEEISRSYHAGCYRSSIVMLWTVVVCDLYFKLYELRDVHSDANASKLIDTIKEKQKAKNKAEWETFLVKEMASKLGFFDGSELMNILHLKDLRHRSAHPVLSQVDFDLYRPSREDAAALIRHCLVSVFTRNPLFSARIVESFLSDLAARASLLPDEQACRKYIENKWLKYVPDKTIATLFRAVWKFAFVLENDENGGNGAAGDPRQAYVFALSTIVRAHKQVVVSQLRSEPQRFISIGTAEGSLSSLHWFLQRHPDFWGMLDQSTRAILSGYHKTSISIEATATYVKTSFVDHLLSIKKKLDEEVEDCEINTQAWESLFALAIEQNHYRELLEFAIDLYVKASSYASANHRARVVFSKLEELTEEDIKRIVEGTEQNSQLYNRGAARKAREKILARATELNLEFDKEKYPKFYE